MRFVYRWVIPVLLGSMALQMAAIGHNFVGCMMLAALVGTAEHWAS
jgi:cytochrome b subunit of formate dehydrogenase